MATRLFSIIATHPLRARLAGRVVNALKSTRRVIWMTMAIGVMATSAFSRVPGNTLTSSEQLTGTRGPESTARNDTASSVVAPAANYFRMSGFLSGLDPSLGSVLVGTAVGTSSISALLSANGQFTFDHLVADGVHYEVQAVFLSSPHSGDTGQTCEVINGTGVIRGRDVTNIRVICRISTTTTLTTPAVFSAGQSTTVQIAVLRASGSAPLDGSVTVIDADSSASCTATVSGDGAASCPLTLNKAGYHHLTATYQSSGFFLGSQASVTVLVSWHPPGTRCYVNQAAMGANNGNSWTDAYTDLQDALLNYCSEIWVASGTYTPSSTNKTISFQVLPGMGLYGGFAGNEATRDARDPAANITVLSGEQYNYHVLTIDRAGLNIGNPGPNTVVDGFNIFGGASPDNGGGVLCKGSPSLSNLNFMNNKAAVSGGALYGGSPSLSHVTFYANSAASGGAIADSSATLSYATFNNNYASQFGGAIASKRQSFTMAYARFNENSAANGGAIYNRIASPVLTHVIFRGNSATQSGGAIYNDGSSDADPVYGFSDDSGGISSPELNDVTFVGNSAQDGGAMYSMGDKLPSPPVDGLALAIGNSSPILTNVTFNGNRATRSGGAIVNNAGFGASKVSLINVTLNGNSAACGGAIQSHVENLTLFVFLPPVIEFASGTNILSATNVIVWGNSSPQICITATRDNRLPTDPPIHSPQLIYDHSIVQNSHGSGGSWDTSLGTDSGGNLDVDPKLSVLKDNGGFTPTMLPADGSAAIDTGNDAKCPTIDQRGYTRPSGPHCDIGAVEAGATPPNSTIATTTTLTAPPTANVGTSITASVTVAAASGTAKPIGSVTISGDSGSPSCSFTLNNGAGSCTLTFASTGNRILTASYAGGSGFAASNGTAAVQVGAISPVSYLIGTTVNPAGGGRLNCVPNPVVSGGSSTCAAAANVGYVFAGFAGDCSSATPTCTLSNVTANKAVIANFSVNASAKPVPTPMLDRWAMLLLVMTLCGFVWCWHAHRR